LAASRFIFVYTCHIVKIFMGGVYLGIIPSPI